MSLFDLFRPVKKKPLGIRVQHTNYQPRPGVTVHLVPCMWLPFPVTSQVPGKDECPTCGVIHPVKTIHLHLDSIGACLVSEGVLELLQKAGLEANDLRVIGSTDNPPPLRVDGKTSRPEIDQINSRIQQWNGNRPTEVTDG